MATIEGLYKSYEVLAEAKDKAGEHEKEYVYILSGVKGGTPEKKLASQFIAKYFSYFPQLGDQAIDAQLDLCEDDDIMIRKQAIKGLPAFCKENKDHVPKLADVLTQLLQSEDAGELGLVQSALLELFKSDALGALGGIFSQILQGEETVRDRAIRFMATKLRNLPEDYWKPEIEEFMVKESKKVLEDVTGDEFLNFIKILAGLKSMSTMQGRSQLVDIVAEQADLDQPFEPTDPDNVDRLIQCVKQAMPYFSKNVHSTRFLLYMCDNVLPVLHDIKKVGESPEGEEEKSATVDLQLEILKQFAEMSSHIGELENATERVAKVYKRLLEYMPLPPAETENGENTSPATPQLQFSHVECLMFAFHQMGRKCPEFLTDAENADRLKDFKIRLQYFARGVQVYIKQLRVALQGKTGEALKTDENKIKVMALKITNNINILIKDLFHNPPSYKAVLSLSWKPLHPKPAASPGQKRPSTGSGDGSGGKKQAVKPPGTGKMYSDRQLYSPPSGKYSEKAGNYSQGNRGRGRGQGRFRGGRGRGRGGGGGYRRW